jgi:beta-galactosidase
MRHTQSLNGEWQVVSDPSGMGERQHWEDTSQAAARRPILVPEDGLRPLPQAGAIDWYYREFARPEIPPNHLCRLAVESAGYHSTWWLNGHLLGVHEGSFSPFKLDIPLELIQDTNVIAVRIDDSDGAAYRAAAPRGWHGDTWKAPVLHGIGGDIALECLPQSHIRSVFVKPDLRRKRITADVESQGANAIVIAIDGTDLRFEGQPGRIQIELPEFETWTPDSPHLYTLRVRLLADGETVDECTVAFGMREFTIRDQRFYLNNHPLYLKGTRLPDGGAAWPAATLLARLKAARAMGFNVLCTDNTPPSANLLVACDELGLLVWGETALGRLPRHAWNDERLQTEVLDVVEARRNHPSLIAWTLSSALEGQRPAVESEAETLQTWTQAAHALDPSRLMIDCGAVYAGLDRPSQVFRPYQKEFDPLAMLRIFFPAPAAELDTAFLQHIGTPALPHFIEACGTGALAFPQPNAQAKQIAAGLDERGLDKFVRSPEELAKLAQEMRFQECARLIDALRSNENLCGYCAGYLYDTDADRVSGYLNLDGRPKSALQVIAAAQQAVRPLVYAPQRNLTPRDEVDVVVRAANDKRLEGQADLSLQVVGPTNQVLWKKKRGLRLSRSRKEIWTGAIAASGSPGAHRFVVRLMQAMQQLGHSDTPFHVYDRPEAVEVAINLVDPDDAWRERCMALAAPGKLDAPIHVIPPLSRTIRAYPETELSQVLSAIREGAVGLFFGPPADWNDLAADLDSPLQATTVALSQAPYGALQYAKLHPIFEGLPARCIMDDVYRHVMPLRGFLEKDEEDICGALDVGALLRSEGSSPWRSTLLSRRFGSGRMVFTHLDILDQLGSDPVADKLFVNLLTHFARRAVPSEEPGKEVAEAAQWIRRERQGVRKWKVLGFFPLVGDSKALGILNEPDVDLDAAYAGPHRELTWQTWHSVEDEGHRVDITQGLYGARARGYASDSGVAYAYAEFHSDRRQAATLHCNGSHVKQIWYNGRPLKEDSEAEEVQADTTVTVRQGRNQLLVKIEKRFGSTGFAVDLSAPDPVRLTWVALILHLGPALRLALPARFSPGSACETVFGVGRLRRHPEAAAPTTPSRTHS